MSEFCGLWKHQNNPAYTKSVSVHHVEAGHYTKEEEEEFTSNAHWGVVVSVLDS